MRLQQVAAARGRGRLLFHFAAAHLLHFHDFRHGFLFVFFPPHFGSRAHRSAAQHPGSVHPNHADEREQAALSLHRIAISEVFNNVGRILGPVLFVYFCR